RPASDRVKSILARRNGCARYGAEGEPDFALIGATAGPRSPALCVLRLRRRRRIGGRTDSEEPLVRPLRSAEAHGTVAGSRGGRGGLSCSPSRGVRQSKRVGGRHCFPALRLGHSLRWGGGD